MTLNTLFLPLLGGFLFYHFFYGTRLLAPYQSPQAVLFWAASIGLLALIISREVIVCLQYAQQHHEMVMLWCLGNATLPLLLVLIIGFFSGLIKLIVEIPPTNDLPRRTSAFRIFRLAFHAMRRHYFKLFIAAAAMVLLILLGILRKYSEHNLPFWVVWFVIPAAVLIASARWAPLIKRSVPSILIRFSTVSLGILVGMHFVCHYWSDAVTHWKHLAAPIIDQNGSKGLISALLACGLGPLAAVIFNSLYTKEAAAERYLRSDWSSELEKLASFAGKRGRPLMLSMKDRKVYVGTVSKISTNSSGKAIQFLPYKSGYRDKDTMTVKFTTHYQQVYKDISAGERQRFIKIFLLADVVCAGFYEDRFYEMFQSTLETNAQ